MSILGSMRTIQRVEVRLHQLPQHGPQRLLYSRRLPPRGAAVRGRHRSLIRLEQALQVLEILLKDGGLRHGAPGVILGPRCTSATSELVENEHESEVGARIEVHYGKCRRRLTLVSPSEEKHKMSTILNDLSAVPDGALDAVLLKSVEMPAEPPQSAGTTSRARWTCKSWTV